MLKLGTWAYLPHDNRLGPSTEAAQREELENAANMFPINDSSIVFVGFTVINNMWYASEVQSVYANALLDGRVELPDQAKMRQDVAYVNAYMRLRIPTYGQEGNYLGL